MIISSHFALALSAMTLITYLACATDPGPLQDYCVAVPDGNKKMMYVNGKFCEDPQTVTSKDFVCSGEDVSEDGLTSRTYKIESCPALNTLGVSGSISTWAPGVLIWPHFHVRASQLETVVKGRLLTAFRTSDSSGERVFVNVRGVGDSVVLPEGMPHFVANIWKEPAETFLASSSQNEGTIYLDPTTPEVSIMTVKDVETVARVISLDDETVDMIKMNIEALKTY